MADVGVDTLHHLARRLARLEFYLDRSSDGNRKAVDEVIQGEDESIASALSRLQSRFATTCAKHPETNDILQLRRFP